MPWYATGMTEAKPSATCFNGCKPITSTREYHCIICHESFYTLKAFDEHRLDPDTPEEFSIQCWMPETCGLVKEKGMWAYPADHKDRQRIEDKLQKARDSR
jgi:hypothetical protein